MAAGPGWPDSNLDGYDHVPIVKLVGLGIKDPLLVRPLLWQCLLDRETETLRETNRTHGQAAQFHNLRVKLCEMEDTTAKQNQSTPSGCRRSRS